MKNKNKKIKNTSKYGVFKGNLINSDLINEESNLTAEEYSDDFFSIKKVKHGDISEDDKYLAIKRKNKKNFIVYKVFGYIIILLMLLIFIIIIIVLI